MPSPADQFVEEIADRVVGKASPKFLALIEEVKKIIAEHDANVVSSNPAKLNLSTEHAQGSKKTVENLVITSSGLYRLTPFGHIKV